MRTCPASGEPCYAVVCETWPCISVEEREAFMAQRERDYERQRPAPAPVDVKARCAKCSHLMVDHLPHGEELLCPELIIPIDKASFVIEPEPSSFVIEDDDET